MNEPRSDPEDLLGAYALDALDADERRLVEEHLARDPRARREVDELVETAGLLALSPLGAEEPPATLWQRIADEAGVARAAGAGPEPRGDRVPAAAGATEGADPGDELANRRARWAVPLRLVAPVAAAAAVVALLLVVQVVDQRAELRDLRATDSRVARAAEAAFDAPGVRTVDLATDASVGPAAEAVRVAYLPDGTGFLLGEGLESLTPEQTYQLWALVGDAAAPTVISAGILGADPDVAPFKVSGPVVGFVLTIEDAGGVVSSERPAYAAGTFSA